MTDASSAMDAVDEDGPNRPNCEVPPRPAYVPEGFVLHESYNRCCAFYVPSSADVLPPPIQWAPCGPNLNPPAIDCRQVAFDPREGYQYLSQWVTVTMGSNGKQLLHISRVHGEEYIWRLVFETDGPVRYAVLETATNRCTMGRGHLWRDYYVMALNEYPNTMTREGMWVGELGRLNPYFTKRYTDELVHTWHVGPFGIVETAVRPEIYLYPWSDLDSPGLLWSKDDALSHTQFFFTDDAMFWTAGSYAAVKEKVWTKRGGVKDLITYGDDRTRGAGDMGSDGVDMVWLEGPPKPPGDGGLDTYDIIASPYTTESSGIRKRRLRSELGSALGGARFTVGCGLAARSRYDGLRIVRIADGHSWFLPSKGPWGWLGVRAVTCEEVIVSVADKGRPNLVRVRLDSLGPGEPAD